MEMMVVIAVLAIVLAIATPSFTSLINSNRLTAAANEFIAAFQAARSESVRLNRQITLCRSDVGGTKCESGATWSRWIVQSSDNTVLRDYRVPSRLTASANPAMADKITFSPDGFAHAGSALLSGQVSICMPTTRPADNVRTILIVGGAQARIVSSSGGGACNAPSDI